MIRLTHILPVFAIAAAPALAAPDILADLPLTAGLVTAVSGGEVASLLEPGADPHHAALRPSQVRALESADQFFMIGSGLTPWLADASRLVSGEVHVLSGDAGHVAEAGDAPHDHEGMHPWLDPVVALEWVTHIAAELERADPANAETYRRNAEAAAAEIEAAGARTAGRLSGMTGGILAVHDAWGGAADAFGLPLVGTISDGDAAKPGARQLRAVQALLDEGRVSCLLAAPGDDMEQATRIAEAHDLPIATVPLTGAPGEEGLGVYLGILDALGALPELCAG